MDQTTFALIIGALLPIIITVIIGYISGARGDFGWGDAGTINKIVMNYALPLSLFSGMVATPRDAVLGQGSVALALAVALVLSFFLPLVIIRYVFRRDLAMSTLQALAIGSPAVPFIGTSVLNFLFPTTGPSLVTISSIVQNIAQMPVCLILLSMATGQQGKSFGSHVADAIQKPVVWAPVLATVLVLMNIGHFIPSSLVASLALLGKATSGLALFSAGIILFTKSIRLSVPTLVTVATRNIVVPAITLVAMTACGFSPDSIKQAVLTMAIPIGSIVIILAMQYKTGEQEMASSMALSVLSSIITMGAFIWLVN